MEKKYFFIFVITTIFLFLQSCSWERTIPNFEKIDKIDNLSKVKDINITIDEWNLLLQKEIEDRKRGFEELNSNKEYLLSIREKLEKELLEKYNYINITRQLMLIDLQIIKSVTDWFMKESSISDKNYFYKYLNTLNTKERKIFISNIERLINILEKQHIFNKYYYINLDNTKSNMLDNDSKDIFLFTNYYLEHVSYNNNYMKSISDIIRYMDILKIDDFEFWNKEVKFSWLSKIFINKEILSKTIPN